MLGRPASWAPVWKKVTAGSWLIASVCIDLMKQRSSATRAVCGSKSLTVAPLWPCRAKRKPARGDREAILPRGHARQPLAHPDRVGQLGPLNAREHRVCRRTGPSARAPPTGTDRSRAWPWARSWGNRPHRPPIDSALPRRPRGSFRAARPARSSRARCWPGRRSAGASGVGVVRQAGPRGLLLGDRLVEGFVG